MKSYVVQKGDSWGLVWQRLGLKNPPPSGHLRPPRPGQVVSLPDPPHPVRPTDVAEVIRGNDGV